MSKESISESLRALIKNDEVRSEAARLREVFDDVEAAMAAGVKVTVILDTLHQKGFSMSLTVFRSAIQRIRNERKNAHKKSAGSDSMKDTTSKDGINKSTDSKALPVDPQDSKGDNPFHALSNNKISDDVRREDFIYNSVPDKSKIYGNKE